MRFLILVTLIGCGTATVQYDGNGEDIVDKSGANVGVEALKVLGNGEVVGELIDVFQVGNLGVQVIKLFADGVVVNLNPLTGFLFGDRAPDVGCYRQRMAVATGVPKELCAPFPVRRILGGHQYGLEEGALFIYGEKMGMGPIMREQCYVGGNDDEPTCECAEDAEEACLVELVPFGPTKVELPITLE